MSRRCALIGTTTVMALALAVPALGGPTNPVAEVAGIKKDVKKALKGAKQAKRKAKNAVRASRRALTASGLAQSTADEALDRAQSAFTQAQQANSLAAGADSRAGQALGIGESAQAAANEAFADAAAAQATANQAKGSADASAQKLGCPFGASTRSSGICMNDSLRPADDYFAAEDDCEDEGRFLPGVDDLMHYLHKTGQDPGTSGTPEEWTYERFEAGTSETVALIGGFPQHTVKTTATNLPYRCVTHANG